MSDALITLPHFSVSDDEAAADAEQACKETRRNRTGAEKTART